MFIVAEGDENLKEVVGCLSNLVAALYKADNPKIAEAVLSDHLLCEEVMLALKNKTKNEETNQLTMPANLFRKFPLRGFNVNSKCFKKQV